MQIFLATRTTDHTDQDFFGPGEVEVDDLFDLCAVCATFQNIVQTSAYAPKHRQVTLVLGQLTTLLRLTADSTHTRRHLPVIVPFICHLTMYISCFSHTIHITYRNIQSFLNTIEKRIPITMPSPL